MTAEIHLKSIAKFVELIRGEISYDLVLDDDMEFLEGAYRLPDSDWQVFIVSAFDRDVRHVQIVPQRWQSGVTGVMLYIPRSQKINETTVERVLSAAFHVSEWTRVRGPDSMRLR